MTSRKETNGEGIFHRRPRVDAVFRVRSKRCSPVSAESQGAGVPKLRIHFTDLDLARTRLELEIDLMWEIISSVQLLQHADGGLA